MAIASLNDQKFSSTYYITQYHNTSLTSTGIHKNLILKKTKLVYWFFSFETKKTNKKPKLFDFKL